MNEITDTASFARAASGMSWTNMGYGLHTINGELWGIVPCAFENAV